MAGKTAESVQRMGDNVVPFTWWQELALVVIAALILSVPVFRLEITIGAFTGVAVLSLARMVDEKEALKAIRWSVWLMVCGVTVLIHVAEKTGRMELLTSMLSSLSTQQSISGVIALVTGAISVYSSSSGVVLPAFRPTIPGLVEKLGGDNAPPMASLIIVGSHLVDVLPLSTLGALRVANATPYVDRR